MAWIEDKNATSMIVRWRDDDGKKRSRTFSWSGNGFSPSTEAEARAEAQQFADAIERTERGTRRMIENRDRAAEANRKGAPNLATWNEDEATLAAYLRQMIDRQDLRDSTRELYLRNVRNHIDGRRIASMNIREITGVDLADYWAGLDIGPAAKNNVHQLLSKTFNRAVLEGIIDVNPLKRAPDVKRRKADRPDERPLDVDEVERLADGATNGRDRLEILVMAYGGLRAGEVGGLRLGDIDFERCQLRLQQQVVRVTGRGQYIERLKTRAARRTVTLPCSVTEELMAFIAEEPPAEDGRVFHGKDGAMRAHNAINHGVKYAARKAGIDAHAHGLRHTAVSLMIREGHNPREVQKFIGHADVRETLGTYASLFDYSGKAIGESLEKLREQYRNRD